MSDLVKRCTWVDETNAMYCQYHDEEWGIPVYNDEKLFEMLILEIFQSGLSWMTILKKREAFRTAFDDFDIEKISMYDDQKVKDLLSNSGIIRNHKKIEATIQNAKVVSMIQQEFNSFASYIWHFTNNEVIVLSDDVPIKETDLSKVVAKDLKRRGMKGIGSMVAFSYLEAIGVYNHHSCTCFKYKKIVR